MIPIVHKINHRVEVIWTFKANMTENETKDLADYLNQMKDVKATAYYDQEFECSNCHVRYPNVMALEGCCEANPVKEG